MGTPEHLQRLAGDRLNILVLADRCWSHPQGGGTGANLLAQVLRWAGEAHQVTVIAGDYPGAKRVEHIGENLVVHRMGGRATVFPRGVWAVLRGLGREADVVLEIINGITFLTPMWLRKPRVALVCHSHRDLYVGEFGPARGRLLAALMEELPLRLLYRRAPFLTISESARADLVEIDGIPRDHISVSYCGVEPDQFAPAGRSPEPLLLYLGRLKAYKRIDLLLDLLEAVPGAKLDIVGDGDHREALEAEIARRELDDRVRMYGYVDDRTRAEMYGRAWILLTASSSEGWGLTVIEAALCGTPSAALAVGGLRESIVDGETGLLAADMDELTRRVRDLVENRDELERLGEAARRRALTFTWERTAAANLGALRAQVEQERGERAEELAASPLRRAAASVREAEILVAPERGAQWRVRAPSAEVDAVLTEFVARRIMKITRRRPGQLEVKAGSALALGSRARALDWLPLRGRIEFGADGEGGVLITASIRARGRPHLRRRFFDELYEQKLTSWLADLDRSLAAIGGSATTGTG